MVVGDTSCKYTIFLRLVRPDGPDMWAILTFYRFTTNFSDISILPVSHYQGIFVPIILILLRSREYDSKNDAITEYPILPNLSYLFFIPFFS